MFPKSCCNYSFVPGGNFCFLFSSVLSSFLGREWTIMLFAKIVLFFYSSFFFFYCCCLTGWSGIPSMIMPANVVFCWSQQEVWVLTFKNKVSWFFDCVVDLIFISVHQEYWMIKSFFILIIFWEDLWKIYISSFYIEMDCSLIQYIPTTVSFFSSPIISSPSSPSPNSLLLVIVNHWSHKLFYL